MNKSNNSVLSLAVISMLTWIIYTFNKLPVYLTTHMYDIKVNCFWRGVSWSMYGKNAVKLHYYNLKKKNTLGFYINLIFYIFIQIISFNMHFSI